MVFQNKYAKDKRLEIGFKVLIEGTFGAGAGLFLLRVVDGIATVLALEKLIVFSYHLLMCS
jgi:hypothetical protein